MSGAVGANFFPIPELSSTTQGGAIKAACYRIIGRQKILETTKTNMSRSFTKQNGCTSTRTPHHISYHHTSHHIPGDGARGGRARWTGLGSLIPCPLSFVLVLPPSPSPHPLSQVTMCASEGRGGCRSSLYTPTAAAAVRRWCPSTTPLCTPGHRRQVARERKRKVFSLLMREPSGSIGSEHSI